MSFLGRPIPKEESLGSIRATGREAQANSGGEAQNGASKKEAPVRFEAREPYYTFSQVVASVDVIEQFDVLVSRIKNHKLLYEEWGLGEIDPQGKHIAFNLYGPPGTGKTMCVEAVAHRMGLKVIDVSYAEIESKYVGETGKNIAAAFQAATEQNALLFFDEADSILGKRMTTVSQASDHGVNVARAVMLKQLDGFQGVVGFATNLARNYDQAFVRRILMHIHLPLPDVHGRKHLWKKLIPVKVPGSQHVDHHLLADASESLSGGDIKNAVVNALALVASKTGEHRVLSHDTLLGSIQRIQASKREVGTPFPTLTEEIVDHI